MDAYTVDLTDLSKLADVLRNFLRLGVCQVEGVPCPGLLKVVELRLLLPDGIETRTKGQVIYQMGPLTFLVQLENPLDPATLVRLAAIAAGARPASREGPVAPPTEGREVPEPAAPRPAVIHAVADVPRRLPDEPRLAPDVPRRPPDEPRLAPDVPRRPPDEPRLAPDVPRRAPIEPRPGHIAPPPETRPPTAEAGPAVSVDDLLEGLPVEVAEVVPEGARDLVVDGPAKGHAPVELGPSEPPGPGAHGEAHPDLAARAEGAGSGQDRGVPTGLEGEESDLYARVRDLPLHEKHRLARTGRRTIRQLLIRDQNKAVHVSVITNPQITLEEVIEYSANPGLSRDAIELIAQNRTWCASKQVLLNIVRNPSTPIEIAARLLPRLGPQEWRILMRPGAVRPTIAALARKLNMDTGDE